ncbi:hypothetical protein KKI24_16790 [bacterium]|nr:hypothetical protein [bacterium]
MKHMILWLIAVCGIAQTGYGYDDPAFDREMRAVMWAVCECGTYESYVTGTDTGNKICGNACYTAATENIRQSVTPGTLFYSSCETGYTKPGSLFVPFADCLKRVCEVYGKSLRKKGFEREAQPYANTVKKCDQRRYSRRFICYTHFFTRELQ